MNRSRGVEANGNGPRRPRRVRAVFDAVADQDAGDRSRMLDQLCGGQTSLRREVERLLARAGSDDQGGLDADLLPEVRNTMPPDLPGFDPLVLLGRGGMGEVFATRRHCDGRPVAIKWPFPGIRGDARRLRRFRREGVLLARLDHPRIVRLLGEGWHEGTPYLVLHLVEGGRPIDRFVRESGIDLRGIIELGREVALALAHAHERGLVHRDLKASNVLVDAQGHPILLDFGIAKVAHVELATSLAYTTAEELLGSLEAMSPEQTRLVDAPVDGRSDIYQLALMLRDLVSPRDAARVEPIAPVARLRAITRRARIGAIAGDPRLAVDLRRVLRSALRRHPEDRHRVMEDLAEDLAAILAGRFHRPTAQGGVMRAVASSKRMIRRLWR